MNEELSQAIEKSIQLEMKIADLYTIFQAEFPEDAAFWQQMVLEERNHAALIGGARTTFARNDDFPTQILTPNMQALDHTLERVKGLIKRFGKNPPKRELALTTAFEIEEAAGEVHYQRAMEETAASLSLEVFRQLNDTDKDHARRIRSYMNANGL